MQLLLNYPSTKTYVVTPHYKLLSETVLMRCHTILCLTGEFEKTRAVTRQHSSPEPVLVNHEVLIRGLKICLTRE